jgi:hypothetical protein
VSRAVTARPHPGTRPPAPVRLDEIPADWRCTWTYRIAVWSTSAPPGKGHWELKFINAACPEHGRLAA